LGSKLLFQITERGLERLEWLRAQADSALKTEKSGSPLEPLITSILIGLSKRLDHSSS
jgi:hypothetical protein